MPLFDLRLTDSEVAAVRETLESGWLTMGPRTQEFEEAFAAQLGARHAIAVSSGTAALHLAYLGAGVGAGHEVIVPAITFVATAAAARYCGAIPVLADVLGPHDLGLDPADVEARVTPKTKAVCAVHYAGYAAPLAALQEVCDRHGLALIEDAAHAPSATSEDGRKLGTAGVAGAFSFFTNKVLSCGEGGLVCTDDDELAALARSRRSHAMTSSSWDRHRGHAAGYDVVDVGFNYRIDEPRAALLLARLPGLEAEIAARRELVHRYRGLLEPLGGVSAPYAAGEVDRSSCYVMPVMVDEADRRDPLRELLSEQGIQTNVIYPSLATLTAYEQPGNALPRAEEAASRELTLPLFGHMTEEQQDRVIAALKRSLDRLGG